jgi:predicted Mrr-cat superfamily restriction endonuclease
MSYHLIRLGEGSKYVEEARMEGFIAIGWNQIPDLASKVRIKKDERRNQERILESIKKELKAEGASAASVAGQAGQIYRFGFEMQEGDRVLAPLGEGRYLVGEVGAYYYEEHPKGDCPDND